MHIKLYYGYGITQKYRYINMAMPVARTLHSVSVF